MTTLAVKAMDDYRQNKTSALKAIDFVQAEVLMQCTPC